MSHHVFILSLSLPYPKMKSKKKSNDMNLFRRMKERRAERRRLRELRQTAATFATMDVMESKGLLTWDEASRRLLIDSRLAVVMMTRAEKWQTFVRNLFLWTENREAWQRASEDVMRWELKAVREYQAAHPDEKLTREDIERIRDAARTTFTEQEREVRMEAFEMVIVGMRAAEGSQGSQGDRHLGSDGHSEPVPETAETATAIERMVIAVGYYDPETEEMELATWEEVRHAIK